MRYLFSPTFSYFQTPNHGFHTHKTSSRGQKINSVRGLWPKFLCCVSCCCSGDCQHSEHEQVCTLTLKHTSAVSSLHLSSALCPNLMPQRREKKQGDVNKKQKRMKNKRNIKRRRMRSLKGHFSQKKEKKRKLSLFIHPHFIPNLDEFLSKPV